MSTLNSVEEREWIESDITRNSAFKYFMSFESSSVILVPDNAFGGTAIGLSSNARIVVCLCSRKAVAVKIRKRLNRIELRNVFVVVGRLAECPFHSKSFGFIVLHKFIIGKERENRKKALVKELCRVLDRRGKIYISEKLAGISRWFPSLSARGCLSSQIPLCAQKVADIYHYNDVDTPAFVKAIFQHSASTVSDKIFALKRTIYRTNIGVIFHRSVGLQEGFAKSILEEIREELELRIDTEVKGCQIVRIGSGSSVVCDFGNVIVRMPQTKYGLQRCINNFSALSSLLQLSFPLEVPKPLTEGKIEGQVYFAETKVKGYSLDLKRVSGASKRALSQQAYEFLLSPELRVFGTIDLKLFKSIVESEVGRLMGFVRENCHEELEKILLKMKEIFLSIHLPLVVQHGDFKFSNFIYTGKVNKRLTGIVDWDMASIPGLPLIDLLTLLAHQGDHDHRSFAKRVWCLLQNRNNKILQEYLEKTNITTECSKLLAVFAVIRYFTKYFPPERMRSLQWQEEVAIRNLIPLCKQCLDEVC